MPLISDDGRSAHVDPRDGRLKDSGDFAKDTRDFAGESRERRSPRERREPVERTPQAIQQNANNSDPSAALSSVSKSLTGDALKLGFGTALGCAAAAVPVPVVQEVGLATCVFGGIAAAGTALTAHMLEPQESKK
jgi:hypothetical protein